MISKQSRNNHLAIPASALGIKCCHCQRFMPVSAKDREQVIECSGCSELYRVTKAGKVVALDGNHLLSYIEDTKGPNPK